MMKIKKFNTFNEDLTDAGIPKDFMKKAETGKPKPDMNKFIENGVEAFNILHIIKEKEEKYSNAELEKIAIDTIKKLFSNAKVIKIDDINFDVKIVPLPKPPNPFEIQDETDMKRGVSAGVNDDEFANKREEEPEELRPDIDKRRIINALTQGFAMASQEDIIMSDDSDIPADLFQDYFKLIKVSSKTHWMLPNIMKNNSKRFWQMTVPLGRVEIKYDKESKKYTIVAEASILIVLIHEMVKGIYELIAMYGQSGKTAEELERIYKLTDTMSMETEGLKYGSELVKTIREFYDNLENKLIKEGKISKKQDVLASILATMYTYPARDFIRICEELFSTDDSKKPYQELGEIYLSIVDSLEDKHHQIKKPAKKEEKPVEKKYTMDELLDKISKDGYKSLSQEEKDFLKNQSK